MRVKLCVLAFVLLNSTNAYSQQYPDSMTLALELGNVIASEEFCGLKFNQDAIGGFIVEKVAPDDMAFSGNLNTMIGGSKYNHKSMSASSKTAHCTQIGRVAKSYGFTD